MGTPRGKEEHKNAQLYVLSGNSHACFARVIEIACRIIVGVQAKKPMSTSTKQNSKMHISKTHDEGIGPLVSSVYWAI